MLKLLRELLNSLLGSSSVEPMGKNEAMRRMLQLEIPVWWLERSRRWAK